MALHTYQLQISYNVGGQFAQNILHYQFDDASYADTSIAAYNLCNAFDIANTTPLKTMLSAHVTILSYKARALDVLGGFEGILIVAGPPVGLRTGNLSVSACGPVIVLFPTGNAKQRGRVFLPGISDSDCIDGYIGTTYKGVINTNKHLFTDTLTLSGGGTPVATPVVYSRLPKPAVSRVVEYSRLSAMVGTQRRRQRPA